MRLRLAIGILGVCAGFLATTARTHAALEPAYTQEGVQLVGTCGNVWAKADVVRQYVFNTHRSHVDVWLQRTREGQRFTTFAGASPNACSTDIERGVSIIGGIHSIEIIGGMYIYVPAHEPVTHYHGLVLPPHGGAGIRSTLSPPHDVSS